MTGDDQPPWYSMSLGSVVERPSLEPVGLVPDASCAIRLRGLTKTYGKSGGVAKQALCGVDLDIPRGSLFGLLGPNGAGKSTLINIMAGLVLKTQGTVEVWGADIDRDPRRVRASIGVVPQELNIDPFFTPRQSLELLAGLYGVPPSQRRTKEILAALNLTDKAEAYARTLSGGMRRRLMVAKALVHRPPVLVLDEPTAGVDVELRQQLWAYVRELNNAGTTVLLTTHYLQEAEELCDRIAIMAQGRLVACDTRDGLMQRIDSKTLTLVIDQQLDTLPPGLAALGGMLDAPNRLVFHYRRSEAYVNHILAAVQDHRLSVIDLSTEEAKLEDIFLQLTRTRAEPAGD
jgi:ABC-2 type transport system ATP-binding protein